MAKKGKGEEGAKALKQPAKTLDAAVDPALRAPALALGLFGQEVTRRLDVGEAALARQDAAQLAGVPAYSILLFLTEMSEAGMSTKHYKALLARHDADSPAALKAYPMLSQTVLFELFANLGVSRESIRRLLILLAAHGLVDRVSKGPPFPDQLAISKEGRKLMGRVGKRLSKELAKNKPFAYL